MSRTHAEQLVLIQETPVDESHTETGDKDVLRKVRRAARLMVEAQTHFREAVNAARRSGCSWRRIGNAAGVPFQTLHRQMTDHGPRVSQK